MRHIPEAARSIAIGVDPLLVLLRSGQGGNSSTKYMLAGKSDERELIIVCPYFLCLFPYEQNQSAWEKNKSEYCIRKIQLGIAYPRFAMVYLPDIFERRKFPDQI